MRQIKIGFILAVSIIIVACSEKNESKDKRAKESKKALVSRNIDVRDYSQGQALFVASCAGCHGLQGEGAKDWRIAGTDGKYPAPPLNGTGHTWHHSNQSLTNTIKNGTAKIGGNMPAWEDKLSDKEIKLILLWVKAQWPDELYTAWYNRFH